MSPDDPPGGAGSLRQVRVRRISTGDAAEPPVSEMVSVVLEAPTTVDVQGVGTFTLLCTPGDDRALATGFLLSEGIIDGMADLTDLRECSDDPEVIRVKLARPPDQAKVAGRNLLIVSSCGLCGAEDLEEKLQALSRVGDSLRIAARTLRSVGSRLRDHQPLFRASGGTHAAEIFTASGEIVSSAEDAGRHNALDKAIGRCLLAGGSAAGCGVALSGRVSLEMVIKCARAGIEIVSAVSAPTSLAIEVAERCGITLCAFVRETRASIFTHPGRITCQGEGDRGPEPE